MGGELSLLFVIAFKRIAVDLQAIRLICSAVEVLKKKIFVRTNPKMLLASAKACLD